MLQEGLRLEEGMAANAQQLQGELQDARARLRVAEDTKHMLTAQVGLPPEPEGWNPWGASRARRRSLIP